MTDKGRAIRVPAHMGEKIRKMTRTSNELSAELEREPTDEEVAERLDWKVQEVRDAKGAIPDVSTSLNRPLGPGDDASEIGELVEDERGSDTAGEVMLKMEATSLQEAIERLPKRHRYVLVRRYGLDDQEPATLAELREELKVSNASYNAAPSKCSRRVGQEVISDALTAAGSKSKSQMSLATALLALCPYLEGAFPSVTRRPTFLMPRAFTSSAVPSAMCSKGMLTAPVIAPAIMCMAPSRGVRPSPPICRAGVSRLVCL